MSRREFPAGQLLENGFHKILHDCVISGCIHKITHGMVCAGEGMVLDHLRICVIDRCAHGSGDEGIIGTVEDQDRRLGVLHGFFGCDLADIELSVQSGTQNHKGPDQFRRIAPLLSDREDDIPGAGIGAVSDNAPDIFRKVQFGGHKDRSTAHGDTM